MLALRCIARSCALAACCARPTTYHYHQSQWFTDDVRTGTLHGAYIRLDILIGSISIVFGLHLSHRSYETHGTQPHSSLSKLMRFRAAWFLNTPPLTLSSVFSSILMAGFVGDMGLAQKMATQNDHLRVGPRYPILILIDIVCQVETSWININTTGFLLPSCTLW